MNNFRDAEEFMKKYNEYITHSYPKFMISQYVEPKIKTEQIIQNVPVNIPGYIQQPYQQGIPQNLINQFSTMSLISKIYYLNLDNPNQPVIVIDPNNQINNPGFIQGGYPNQNLRGNYGQNLNVNIPNNINSKMNLPPNLGMAPIVGSNNKFNNGQNQININAPYLVPNNKFSNSSNINQPPYVNVHPNTFGNTFSSLTFGSRKNSNRMNDDPSLVDDAAAQIYEIIENSYPE
jgi:hypothetical protein